MTPELAHPDPVDAFDEAISQDFDLLSKAGQDAMEEGDLEEGEW